MDSKVEEIADNADGVHQERDTNGSDSSDTNDFAVVDREDVKEIAELVSEDQIPGLEGPPSATYEDFEDSQKIKVPDPTMAEDEEQEPVIVPSNPEEGEVSMMEGAWADILGSGQLKKKILKRGRANSRPVNLQLCTISLSGKLQDGTTVDVNENLIFQLGDLEVIQGIDLAVALMDVGEISQLEIAPRFAYGAHGNGKDIPPESTILYTVELKDATKEKDLEEIKIDERLKIGNAKRERGNWWYSRGEYSCAIQCYRRALEYLDTENETETDSPDKLQEILDDRLKVYNNMTAAQMKIEAWDAALKSVEHVLRCQTDNVKAIYRKAKIVAAMGKVEEGVALLEKALHLDPSSKIIQQDLARLQAKRKIDAQKEKSLYRKMFGNNDAMATTKPQGQPKIKLGVPWTLLAGTVVAVVASYVTYRFKLF